jgi:outer membrane protein
MALPATETGWHFNLGAGVVVAPAYPGSDKITAFPFPDFEATYGDWFFATPIDGIGAGFQPVENLTLSMALGVNLDERKAADDPRLTGLKDVSYTPDARIDVRYEIRGSFIEGTLRSRLGAAAGRGSELEVDAGRLFLVKGPHYVSAGLTVSFMDEAYARTFFGISPGQAAITGLRPFPAQRGLKDVGGFVECSRALSQHWELYTRVQLSQLQSRAADSPIVLRALQPSLVLTTSYRF